MQGGNERLIELDRRSLVQQLVSDTMAATSRTESDLGKAAENQVLQCIEARSIKGGAGGHKTSKAKCNCREEEFAREFVELRKQEVARRQLCSIRNASAKATASLDKAEPNVIEKRSTGRKERNETKNEVQLDDEMAVTSRTQNDESKATENQVPQCTEAKSVKSVWQTVPITKRASMSTVAVTDVLSVNKAVPPAIGLEPWQARMSERPLDWVLSPEGWGNVRMSSNQKGGTGGYKEKKRQVPPTTKKSTKFNPVIKLNRTYPRRNASRRECFKEEDRGNSSRRVCLKSTKHAVTRGQERSIPNKFTDICIRKGARTNSGDRFMFYLKGLVVVTTKNKIVITQFWTVNNHMIMSGENIYYKNAIKNEKTKRHQKLQYVNS